MTKTKKPKKPADRFVIAATKSRPWCVVAGTLVREDGDTVTLRDARQIIYWPSSVRGVLGLAVHGTPSGSRVSRPATLLRMRGVELVYDATAEARAAIEAEPWT
mgnify:CR=1 FL=1